jgi:Flp pilus assembly protein TadG
MLRFRILHRGAVNLLRESEGAALLEFAIVLPLLMVFVVGIFDFSGAFNQKQKIEQAAQEGAIIAGAQPMSDIASGNGDPDSLHPVVTAVFNSLVGSGVLAKGACVSPGIAVYVGPNPKLNGSTQSRAAPMIWSSSSIADGYLPPPPFRQP